MYLRVSNPFHGSASARRQEDHWACYVAGISVTPVKHLALNLGAPGDRRDAEGRAWFAWPRPRSYFGLKLDVKTDIAEGLGYFQNNPTTAAVGATPRPWVYTSGCIGLSRCDVRLLDKRHGPASYTVRLHFVDSVNGRPGRSVFDIRLQGETVARKFRPSAETGGANTARIREFTDVRVETDLIVELVATAENLAREQAPVLCGIEAIRQGTQTRGHR